MNILIIEDDEFLWGKIKQVFKKRVITNKITLLFTFEDFINELPLIEWYDIILVDIKLWCLNKNTWIDIVEILRKKNINTPIIVISGLNDIEYIERAFEKWANDYLTKPFRLKELEIRIMRWFKSYCMNIIFSDNQILSYHELSYKFHDNQFYYKDNVLDLTKKSKFILFQLLLKKEKIISEEELRIKLWWDREVLKKRNIRIVILRLKKALDKHQINHWIQNIHWEWYILKK